MSLLSWMGLSSAGTTPPDPSGSWSAATSGITTDLYGVYYNSSYWCSVGASGKIRYISGSDPSGSWSGATSGTSNSLWGIYYNGSYWCSVGASGTIRYINSSDIYRRGKSSNYYISPRKHKKPLHYSMQTTKRNF